MATFTGTPSRTGAASRTGRDIRERVVWHFGLAVESDFRFVAGRGGDDFDETIPLLGELCFAEPVGFETEQHLQSQGYEEASPGRDNSERGGDQNRITGGPKCETGPKPVP